MQLESRENLGWFSVFKLYGRAAVRKKYRRKEKKKQSDRDRARKREREREK